MKNQDIDHGKTFDWGRTSEDYAKYRDIYPEEFYDKIIELGLCKKGQKVLDLGTGTGVLPFRLFKYGADFTGVDIAQNQIEHAKRLAQEKNMDISFLCSPAEELQFPDNTFDVVTACQCFFYFDPKLLLPKLSKMLKPGGRFAILYMEWLPEEDLVAGETEKLVLKYNPSWSGNGETRHQVPVPETELFTVEESLVFDLEVPFTWESWGGRIKACRGIGASLSEEEIHAFDQEHQALLQKITPQEFKILHFASMLVLKNNKR